MGAVLVLVLIGCSDTSTSLGISLSEIQSEFEPPIFELERYHDRDGPPAIIIRKVPDIAKLTGEILEFTLIGQEHDLAQATVLFATEIDGMDAMDAGVFIDMVAPSANGLDWMIEGYRAGWVWDGFKEMSGDKGDVHVQAIRLPGFIAITLTPR